MNKFLTLAILLLLALTSFSQTLVNQSILTTLSSPSGIYQYIKAAPLPGGGMAVITDLDVTGGYLQASEVIGLDATGNPIAAFDFTTLHGGYDVGVSLCVQGSYTYAVSATTDSAFSHGRLCNLMKFSSATMDTIWTRSMQIDSAVSQAPFAVLADSSGNVYMGASVQAATDYKIVVCKFNSAGTLLWSAQYDTAGFYTLPVAMVLSGPGTALAVTGFSFDGAGHSDFITLDITAATGHIYGSKASANGTGAISHPIGIVAGHRGFLYSRQFYGQRHGQRDQGSSL